jgi:hypothetical protein
VTEFDHLLTDMAVRKLQTAWAVSIRKLISPVKTGFLVVVTLSQYTKVARGIWKWRSRRRLRIQHDSETTLATPLHSGSTLERERGLPFWRPRDKVVT